jgi:hypothetical protein
VRGSVAAWVRALGPEGGPDALAVSGRQGLADALLAGFAAARSRAAAAAV